LPGRGEWRGDARLPSTWKAARRTCAPSWREANGRDLDLPLVEATLACYEEAMQKGLGQQDLANFLALLVDPPLPVIITAQFSPRNSP
jgi:hypothetical protein